MLLLALFASLTPALQAPDEGWRVIDGVAFQAGDEIVTLSDFQATVRRRGSADVNGMAELNELIFKAGRDSITEHLETQAGEDLGLDTEQIKRLVRIQAEEDQRDKGINAYVDDLNAQKIKPEEALEGQERQYYRDLWRLQKLGRDPTGKRPTRDRYLRPGVLRATFEAQKEAFAEPTYVRLQLLEVPVAAVGSAASALIFVEDLRTRIEEGEDFGDINVQYGSLSNDTQGRTELIPVRSITLTALREFAEAAPLSSLSDPIPIGQLEGQEEPSSYMLVKLLEREEGGPPPPFTEAGVQVRLRRALTSKWEQDMMVEARTALSRRAFVWENPTFGWGPAPSPQERPQPPR